jgi:uncharacterized protein (TIGR02996 family)
MTPEQATFVSQICENPDDDTVRLVYADWLDENGDPDRAAFIRVQVQIAPAGQKRLAVHQRQLLENPVNPRQWQRHVRHPFR